jgi:hypothetical protein
MLRGKLEANADLDKPHPHYCREQRDETRHGGCYETALYKIHLT